MKQYKITLLILWVFLITSCNQSDLSSQKVDDISLIGTTIEIYQNPYCRSENELSIHLFDEDRKVVSNDSLLVFVNNIKATINNKQGLYYTQETYYSLSNVPINRTYNIEIRLTDGKMHFLGAVSALKEEESGNIECKKSGDLSRNTVIRWKRFKDIDELSAFPIVRLKATSNSSKSYAYKKEILRKIPSDGFYTFSKDEYADSLSTISRLELKFTTTKSGVTNSKLIAGSKITVSTSIGKIVNFEK